MFTRTRLIVGAVALVALVLILLAVFGAFSSGGSSSAAAPATTTTTTSTTPASTTATTPTTGGSTSTTAPATGTTTGTTTGGGSTTTTTAGGSITAPTIGSTAPQACDTTTKAGPSGLTAEVDFAAGPVVSGGSIPVMLNVCRISNATMASIYQVVAFSTSTDGAPPANFAGLSYQNGQYQVLNGNWFVLLTIPVGSSWSIPATLTVPADQSAVSLCVWATFAGYGPAPSHDAQGNALPDWQDPPTQPSGCKKYSG